MLTNNNNIRYILLYHFSMWIAIYNYGKWNLQNNLFSDFIIIQNLLPRDKQLSDVATCYWENDRAETWL